MGWVMDLERAWDPADGDSIDRTQWIQDLDTLFQHQILGTDMHPRAGIGRRQIADRYGIVTVHRTLVPWTPRDAEAANTELGSSATPANACYKLPASGSEVKIPICPIIVPSGTQVWLLGVSTVIHKIVAGGGTEYPSLRIYKGTDVLGGGAQTISVADREYAVMNDPYSVGGIQPLVDCQVGEYLYAGIESSAGGGNAAALGWDIWAFLKVEQSR